VSVLELGVGLCCGMWVLVALGLVWSMAAWLTSSGTRPDK